MVTICDKPTHMCFLCPLLDLPTIGNSNTCRQIQTHVFFMSIIGCTLDHTPFKYGCLIMGQPNQAGLHFHHNFHWEEFVSSFKVILGSITHFKHIHLAQNMSFVLRNMFLSIVYDLNVMEFTLNNNCFPLNQIHPQATISCISWFGRAGRRGGTSSQIKYICAITQYLGGGY